MFDQWHVELEIKLEIYGLDQVMEKFRKPSKALNKKLCVHQTFLKETSNTLVGNVMLNNQYILNYAVSKLEVTNLIWICWILLTWIFRYRNNLNAPLDTNCENVLYPI